MSRCFPYPPPGYERKSGALDEALINSIKLQKEREKAKKEKRKEKKREKREREKAKENGGVDDKKQKHAKRHKNDRGKVEHGVGERPKRTEEEAEQLEKSGLTEEHGQPISFQNLYDSTDSTQNRHKRKKHSLPSDSSHNNLGSIFRIRLKQKDQEISPDKELPCPNSSSTDHILQEKHKTPQRPSEEKQCSTSGRQQQFPTSGRTPIARQESLKQKDEQKIHCTEKLPRSNLGKTGLNLQISEVQHFPTSGRTTTIVQERYKDDSRPSEQQICSTSGGKTGARPLEIVEGARKSSSKLKKIESLYRDLIENWVPPPMENNDTDFDEQEWLFETVSKSEPEPRRCKPSNDGVCEASTSSIWPQACYLPEAEIYALPYTVPF